MRTLEDAILSETQILADNITKLQNLVAKTNQDEVHQLIEKVRRVEEKMSLISTFFQTSLYSNNMLQQDDQEENTNRPAFR
ncbi:hypothetical protein BCR42DRAFT_454416 [Absidia repens]|uniref:DASH complex subunit DAD4 n=1 Tax=Absidia repens TaxID=90262 RepID=A0A1X2I7C0_9FUNG|nr:hypothetical protein BCR42DRAFT_454416 [Absidia repens]